MDRETFIDEFRQFCRRVIEVFTKNSGIEIIDIEIVSKLLKGVFSVASGINCDIDNNSNENTECANDNTAYEAMFGPVEGATLLRFGDLRLGWSGWRLASLFRGFLGFCFWHNLFIL